YYLRFFYSSMLASTDVRRRAVIRPMRLRLPLIALPHLGLGRPAHAGVVPFYSSYYSHFLMISDQPSHRQLTVNARTAACSTATTTQAHYYIKHRPASTTPT